MNTRTRDEIEVEDEGAYIVLGEHGQPERAVVAVYDVIADVERDHVKCILVARVRSQRLPIPHGLVDWTPRPDDMVVLYQWVPETKLQ